MNSKWFFLVIFFFLISCVGFENDLNTPDKEQELSTVNKTKGEKLYKDLYKHYQSEAPQVDGFKYLYTTDYECNGLKNSIHEYEHEATGIEFILVPGGSFIMGSKDTEEGYSKTETPTRKVTIKPFLMSKFEITQGQWKEVMNTEPWIYDEVYLNNNKFLRGEERTVILGKGSKGYQWKTDGKLLFIQSKNVIKVTWDKPIDPKAWRAGEIELHDTRSFLGKGKKQDGGGYLWQKEDGTKESFTKKQVARVTWKTIWRQGKLDMKDGRVIKGEGRRGYKWRPEQDLKSTFLRMDEVVNMKQNKRYDYLMLGDNFPAVHVSWNKAKRFCKVANLKLPSESQWEYACRAGSTSRFYWGDSMNPDYCWFYGNAWDVEPEEEDQRVKFAREIGNKKPNAFGLFDMSGNVDEWCEDSFIAHYENAPTDGRARLGRTKRPNSYRVASDLDATKSQRRVMRGGSFCRQENYLRSAARYLGGSGYYKDSFTGVRLCGPIVEDGPMLNK